MPNTVVAAQVAAGIFTHPYFGDNLRKLPGMDYKIGTFYANLPMPKSSPYACGWWYRDEFTAPITAHKKYYWLRFHGINYRADIWLNGHKIADSSQIAGANRLFRINGKPILIRGGGWTQDMLLCHHHTGAVYSRRSLAAVNRLNP